MLKMLAKLAIICPLFFRLSLSFTPPKQPFARSWYLPQNSYHEDNCRFVKQGNDDVAISPSDLAMDTYGDFRDQLEALSFLSSMSGDEDLSHSAQKVFDEMFERWFEDEDDDFEPDRDIYNLLVSVYSNCGHMENAERILERMESGADDGVPTANTDTYLAVMTGWGICGDIDEAEGVVRRLEVRYEESSDENIQPTTQVYNSLLKILMRSGNRNSPEKAENLLRQMVASECGDNIGHHLPQANTDTFRYVMECYIRNSKAKAPAAVEQLMTLMDKCDNLSSNHHEIVNTKIKLLSQSGKKGVSVAEEAEALLFGMLERYQTDPNGKDARPNAASFIHTINCWSNTRSNQSAQRASKLLTVLEEFYGNETLKGEDCETLKGDTRVYNAVMKAWARSNSKHKAMESKALMERLQYLHESTGDDDYAPNRKTYNHVINAAAYTKGGEESRQEALRVMVETFNLIRGDNDIKPNHVTYGMFLKGCNNLVSDKKKRETIKENVFRKASREGFVSDFVLDSLLAGSDASFAGHLLGGDISDDGIQIPNEWARNVNIQ